jgi:uncharacterized membrane protein YraQ (UPF0718 family)/YHS domain-containing protein
MAAHVLALSAAGVLTDIGRSLREALFMLWQTLWALVLGFGLSGAVQAFVSRRQMQTALGDHRPAALARASVFGMVSSSCSYAASAMAKSLFAKGADFVSAMVFMFASTNLVLELGIVLLVLIGWQFLAGEFVGGVVMVVLLALVGGVVFTRRSVAAARRRVLAAAPPDDGPNEEDRRPWRQRIRSAGGWADAASYTMADLYMLRREMFIGYLVAGFLAVLVPSHVWNDVFVHGHGWATSLENVVVGPFIALISFVCSIGNVPLAAALWKGGISFGGVISFVFADLIAFPLLLVYRRFYGLRMAARQLAVFWTVMSIAGLATQGIFAAAGWTPTTRPVHIVPDHFSWDYTTALNIAFLAVFAVLLWLSRNRRRLGGGVGYALDPVCGMQVEKANAPARAGAAFFCSEHCRDRFLASSGTPGRS